MAKSRSEVNRRYTQSAKGKATRSREARRNHARRMAKYRATARDFVRSHKNVPCADCGGRFDPVCMDFDHRPGEVKLFDVSQAKSHALDEVIAEIAKCDVVCANCHRLRTHRLRDHNEYSNGPRPPQSTSQLSLLDTEVS